MFLWAVVLCQVLKGCFGVLMGCGTVISFEGLSDVRMGCGTVSGFEGLFWCSYGLWYCVRF